MTDSRNPEVSEEAVKQGGDAFDVAFHGHGKSPGEAFAVGLAVAAPILQREERERLGQQLLSDAAVHALYCHAPSLVTDSDSGPSAQEESALIDALEAVANALEASPPGGPAVKAETERREAVEAEKADAELKAEALDDEAQAERATAHALGQKLRAAEEEAQNRYDELEAERQELRMDLDTARAALDSARAEERERIKEALPHNKAIGHLGSIATLLEGFKTGAGGLPINTERDVAFLRDLAAALATLDSKERV